jgi:hypothetical protein
LHGRTRIWQREYNLYAMKTRKFSIAYAFSVAISLFLIACGGNSGGGSTTTPTSTWAGTYSGNLNFGGCPGETPCGGDSITITITEAPNPSIPGEFLPALTITGVDNTSNHSFTGTGTALYDGAAPEGPGDETTWAYITISLGGQNLALLGSGASTTTSPIDIQTCLVHSYTVVSGVGNVAGAYLGTLTRQ